MISYVKYVRSKDWRMNSARLREFKAAHYQCRLCPNSKASGHKLEAHHRSYDRLGCEQDGDLTTLCSECHLGVTSMLRARRYAASSTQLMQESAQWVSDPNPLFDQTAEENSDER
jgi:5-methylcytosine-specific restriction endonuclease McrA